MPDLTLTVCTLNVLHRRRTEAIHADILRLIRVGADVICLQEMGGHARALRNLPHPWRSHLPGFTAGKPGGRRETPIVYNSAKLRLVHKGFRHVSDPQNVEKGAGGSNVAEKTVTWILVRHRASRQPIAILNTHAVASIENNGHPAESRPRRLAVFAALMRVLTDMVTSRVRAGQMVLVCGDLNVNYRTDVQVRDERFPFRVFQEMGVHASYRWLGMPKMGTRRTRLIDYVAYTVDPDITPIRHSILQHCGSDHRPYLVTFRLDPAR
jgi:endonuclease/exonuclease/phosphatase (EEP) superfamily protein YafD